MGRKKVDEMEPEDTEGNKKKIGDGLEDGVEIGPLIDRKAVEFALAHIRDAVACGGKIAWGGKAWEAKPNGNFLEPTILVDVPQKARCMNEETFAPVLPIAAFDEEDEAVRMANSTPYGLAAYVFTQNISRMWRMAEAVEAGTIAVNDSVPSTSQCPFGGMKESGMGRELGHEGLEAYLETKYVSWKLRD